MSKNTANRDKTPKKKMPPKQKKQLIWLAVVLAAAVAVYAGLRVWNAGADDRANAKATHILQLSDVTTLTIERDNASLSFTKTDGTWTYDGDKDIPLSSSKMEVITAALQDVQAITTISSPDALADYGLDSPTLAVTAGAGDGTTSTILIGAASDDNYYAMMEGGSEVYTISSALFDSANYDLMGFIQPESIGGTLTESTVEEVDLVLPDGTTHALTKKTTTQDAQASSTDDASDSTATPAAETVYTWYLDGNEISGDGLNTYISTLSTLYFSSCAAYKPSAQDIAADMGDTSTLTIKYLDDDSQEQSVTLLIGNLDESANQNYAMLEGSSYLNLISADTAAVLLDLSAGTLKAASSQ